MNNKPVSSLGLVVASYTTGLKREVSNPETPTAQTKRAPTNPCSTSSRRSRKGEDQQDWKVLGITALVQPNATQQTTDSTHRPPAVASKAVTGTLKPPPGWCQRRQRQQPGRSLPDSHKTPRPMYIHTEGAHWRLRTCTTAEQQGGHPLTNTSVEGMWAKEWGTAAAPRPGQEGSREMYWGARHYWGTLGEGQKHGYLKKLKPLSGTYNYIKP